MNWNICYFICFRNESFLGKLCWKNRSSFTIIPIFWRVLKISMEYWQLVTDWKTYCRYCSTMTQAEPEKTAKVKFVRILVHVCWCGVYSYLTYRSRFHYMAKKFSWTASEWDLIIVCVFIVPGLIVSRLTFYEWSSQKSLSSDFFKNWRGEAHSNSGCTRRNLFVYLENVMKDLDTEFL